MATDPALVAPAPAAAPPPAADPNEHIYDALRKADAAGDADAVARLSLYLKQVPSGLADGHTQGFADEAPVEAQSTQLAPEQEKALIEYARQPGSTPEGLRQLGAQMGRTISNADEVFKAREAGAGVNDAIHYPLPKVEGGTTTGGAFAGGVGDSASLGLAPRIAAVAGATSDLAHGGEFDYTAHLDKARGVEATDNEDHPYARIGGQLLGGLVLPSGTEGVAFTAGRDALQGGASMAEARAIASAAARNRMAGVGAGYGGAYGFNSSYGSPGERLASGITGAIEGGATGLGAGAVGEVLAPRIQAAKVVARALPPSANEAFDLAAKRVGDFTANGAVDYLAADRPNALPSQWATSLTNLTLGGIPLSDAARKVVQSAKDARDAIAAKIGNFRTNDGGSPDTIYAGQRLQRGAQAFLNQSEKRAGDLYEAIPIASDRPAVLTNTRAALSDLTQGFTSNEALSKLWADNPRLRSTLDALTPEKSPIFKDGLAGGGGADAGATQIGTAFKDGQLSWSDMKRFRSIIGRVIGRPGLEADGDQIDALRKVYGGLSEDMRATAAGSGPQALKAFQRANDYFAGRQKRISDTLAPIFGKNLDATPEDAYRALLGWSKSQGGDFASVARAIRSLPEDDANTVRATILNSMGKVTKGRQDDTNNAFSPSDFVTHWSDLSDRAKSVLFQGDARKAIDDLVTVASGMKHGAQKFANTSKTGIAIGATGTVSGAMAHPLLAPFAIMGQIGAGYLLGKPAFARWLTAYIKKPNAAAALAHVQKLGSVAKVEPAIADDVLQIQQRLASMFADAPQRAAADDKRDKQ